MRGAYGRGRIEGCELIRAVRNHVQVPGSTFRQFIMHGIAGGLATLAIGPFRVGIAAQINSDTWKEKLQEADRRTASDE